MTARTVDTGARGARVVALVTYVFRACLPRTRLAVLALPVGTTILAGLLARVVDADTRADAVAAAIDPAVFGLALPLGALIIGDAVLGAEVRAGTLGFTWATPTRFWELALARWLGGWIVAAATLVPAVGVATVLGGDAGQAGPAMLGAAAGTGAHIALFVAIGAATKRAAVWSLAIVFLGERLLGATLSGIAQLSPTWLGRATWTGTADLDDLTRSGIPDGIGAIGRLGIVTVVALALATVALARMELSGSRD